MKPMEIFIGVFLFSLVAASFGWALGQTAQRYYVAEDDFSGRFTKIANVSIVTTDIHDSIQQKGSTQEGAGNANEDSETGIIRGSWSVIKKVPQIYQYVINILYELTKPPFTLPEFVITTVLGIIIISIAFALLSAVFKYRL